MLVGGCFFVSVEYRLGYWIVIAAVAKVPKEGGPAMAETIAVIIFAAIGGIVGSVIYRKFIRKG